MKAGVRADWTRAVLVCRKCSKKLHGGFGADGTLSLAKALRGWSGGGKSRKCAVGIVEVECLKVCPKHAVTVVDARRPGGWLLIAEGMPVAEIAARLELDPAD